MPFRRKHRNPLFGSSRSEAANKENTSHDGASMDQPMAATMQLQIPLSLLRCQSDTTQRTCSDMNPNTLLRRSSSQTKNRHGSHQLSTTKESNLQLLNSTLVKEVSSLRASNYAMAKEKEDLENEVTHLEAVKKEAVERFDAAEDRLQNLGLVVDKLQDMNGVLAEEAARLREDTDRFAQERQSLLADLEKKTMEKSLLEELLEIVRASGNAFREEMQQALLQADVEKKALAEEKETILLEKQELQLDTEKLTEEVTKLSSDMSSLLLEKVNMMEDMAKLEKEVSAAAMAKQALEDQLSAKKQALASAQENLVKEKVRMLSEKTELELSIRRLRQEHEEALKQVEAENQASHNSVELLKGQVQQLRMENMKLTEERDGYIHEVTDLQIKLHSRDMAAIDAQKLFDMQVEALSREKENQTTMLHREVQELRSQAREKEEQVFALRNELGEYSKKKSALEATVKAGIEKQHSMETHIQSLKSDLLRAEGAASEAQMKAKAVQKEAAMAMERRTREASQKVGALESKLAAMTERQGDMESALKGKEEVLRAAIHAEREAKEGLDAALAKGKSIGGKLEQLRAEYSLIQSRAMTGTQKIASLLDELSELGDGVAVTGGSVPSRRPGRGGRRKATKRVYQPKVCQPKL